MHTTYFIIYEFVILLKKIANYLIIFVNQIGLNRAIDMKNAIMVIRTQTPRTKVYLSTFSCSYRTDL